MTDGVALETSELVNVGYCLGMIDAVKEGVEFFDGATIDPLTCFPEKKLSKKTLVALVINYFIFNPEEVIKYKKSSKVGLHDLIRKSFHDSYPCE